MKKQSTPAPTEQTNSETALKDLLASITKKHGQGALMELGSKVGQPVPHLPTGVYALDYQVIGIGGLPKGRIVEVFGSESSGKTTIALKAIASVQKVGGKAAFIDAEHALDPSWAAVNGVDVDKLLISQPDYGEQALQIVQDLVESALLDLIVVDSVAALVPKSELDGEIGDAHVGLQARLMGQAMRMLAGKASKTGTCILFINQIREKIGQTYGDNTSTPGGRALKFYASVRLDVRRIAQIKDGDVVIGNRTKFKAVKNKCGPPFRTAEVNLLFGTGFDSDGSIIEAAVDRNIITKSGSWYSFEGERIGQGIDSVKDWLTPERRTQILNFLKES